MQKTNILNGNGSGEYGMVKIGQLTTEKSIEKAMKEIKEWLSRLNVTGLDIDLRYDAKTNVAVLRFKFKGKDYEFISRKQSNCRLNMWGVARVMEFKVRAQLMEIEDFSESMFRYKLEGKVEPSAASTPANEMNYVKLGISPLASNQEIQNRYKELMKSLHPDMVTSEESKKALTKKAQEINEAWSEIRKERGI